jgi:hypothetical protein
MPYKRPQIVHCLESLIKHADIREVDPTTKRLVDRCLGGEWCAQYRSINVHRAMSLDSEYRADTPISPASDVSSVYTSQSHAMLAVAAPIDSLGRQKSLKSSRSHENLSSEVRESNHKGKDRLLGDTLRRGSNDSSMSLPRVAAASANPVPPKRRSRGGSASAEMSALSLKDKKPTMVLDELSPLVQEPPGISVTLPSPLSPPHHTAPSPPLSAIVSSASAPHTRIQESSSAPTSPVPSQRRPAPPPPKRRKPPAIPASRSNGGATITTIASSSSSSLTPNARLGSARV